MEIFSPLFMVSNFCQGEHRLRRNRKTTNKLNRLSSHEVRQIYPNKYITVDDRIYVYYTLFNLPGVSSMHDNEIIDKFLFPEIYLIACLIDYFSHAAKYLEYVGDVTR
jgi:hypothetical protein